MILENSSTGSLPEMVPLSDGIQQVGALSRVKPTRAHSVLLQLRISLILVALANQLIISA